MQESKSQSMVVRKLFLNFLGVIVGLFFGVPPALGAHSIGMAWIPYCIGVLIIGLVVGLLMGFMVTEIHLSANTSGPACFSMAKAKRHEDRGNADRDASRKRLEQGTAWLERLAEERLRLSDSEIGKAAEQRIVWEELLDLELQDIDEQLHHIVSNGEHNPQP